MATAAIWYESDGYRLEGRPLMGRRVAGQEFLKAFARFARTDRFTAVVRNRQNQGEFVATMRTGVDSNGHELNRQMPWRPIGRMGDEELMAIYEYLTHMPRS